MDTATTARSRAGRTWRRASVVLMVGVALGVALALVPDDEVIEPPAEPVLFGGPVLVIIDDLSETVEQYGPPTLEVSSVDGTVTFEQYSTAGQRSTGLAWSESEPVVVTFRPWDLALEPGFSASLDLAPYGASLRGGALDAPRRALPLLVHVTVGTASTQVRVSVDGDVVLERSIDRQDWRAERSTAAERCAADVEDLFTATRGGVDDLEALFRTWYGRSQSYPRWIAEADRAVRLVRSTRSTLPTDDERLVDLPRATMWIDETRVELDRLEAALQALRSASVAESPDRFTSSFRSAATILQNGLVPLAESAQPLVWCATR